MPIHARYVHTNLIAKDWRRLAHFYQDVFACEILPPERDLAGPWLEKATALPGAHIRGAHLRLPGYENHGPTLEIFEYDPAAVDLPKDIHRPGFGHIAFQVDDVQAACAAVLAAGGKMIGEIVSLTVAGAGVVNFAYTVDPEGNAIELQRWE